MSDNSPFLHQEERARHKVILTDLRLGWTPSNRNIMFHLLDIYNKSQVLQKSLASDALKGFKVDMATPSVSIWMLTRCGVVMAT